MLDEEIRKAYEEIRPDSETKEAMLRNILAADSSNPSKNAARPRRWLAPALGAAAAMLCVLALPHALPGETPEPPQPSMVQDEEAPSRPSRPLLGSAAPEQISYSDGVYVVDRDAPAPEMDQLLEELENGALYSIPNQDPSEQIALNRDGTTYLCRRAGTQEPEHQEGERVP